MKAIGKIGNISVAYQQEKTGQDGHKFWGERYTIFFESGDDIHMVDSGWIHCQGKDGGMEILKQRRGIQVGAVGEMIFRYGFRNWNGKRFPECVLVQFTSMSATQPSQQAQAAPAAEPATNQAAQAAPAPAPEQPAAEAKIDENGDSLPF